VCRSEDPPGKLLTNIRRDGGGFAAAPGDFKGPLNYRGPCSQPMSPVAIWGYEIYFRALK
jgi:hypothetical protein